MTTRRRTVIVAGALGAVPVLAGCEKYGDEGAEPEPPAETGGGEPSGDGPSGSEEATTGGQEKPPGEELAKTSDIEVGGGKIFEDKKVVVTQPSAGQFKAFSAVCTHSGCTVASVEGGTINCPCHGSKYAVADASVQAGPAPRPLAEQRINVDGESIRLA